MQFETTVEIDAPAEAVWAALVDVGRWPEWTESIQDVRWLDDDGVRVGARARIKQPGTPALTWIVTELDAGRAFAWEAASVGVRTVGTHAVSAAGQDRSTLTLGLRQSGALAGVVAALTGGRTRKFVRMEADGLKRAAEAASAEPAAEAASAEHATDASLRAADRAPAEPAAGVRPAAG